MSPALLGHIGAGLIALVFGATALTVKKGGRWHRRCGIVFALAMLSMALLAAYLSLTIPDLGNLPGGLFTCYLVVTGWGTVRLRQRGIGAFERSAFVAVLAVTAITIACAMLAQANPDGLLDGKPAAQFVIFATLELFAALLDLKIIVSRRLLPVQRTARHIWRMCAALFFASGSFFLGQQKIMPAAMQGSPVLTALAFAPLVMMVFWLWRNRRNHRLGRAAPQQLIVD